MLLWLTDYLAKYYHGFQVFHYLTLRAVLAALTALVLAIVCGPGMIKLLRAKKLGQPIRDCGPTTHYEKAGTPTMGGVLILLAVLISTVLWADLSNYFIGLVLFVMLGFGAVGAVDDYQKLTANTSRGLAGRYKYLLLSAIGLIAIVALYAVAQSPIQTQLIFPFVKHVSLQLSWFFIVLSYFVIVGSSNAVNLTDGLDGLAILPCVLIAAALGVFAYVAGNSEFAHYLTVPYVAGSGEVVIICSALVGAGLGFLWFNSFPAEVFMGDVGSLALGGTLGMLAVIVRQEIAFFIMAGVFVLETVSVILQVGSYKLRNGKRIFRMAPIHHHFELKGWPEPKVIVRFWIITVILVLIGLSSLKIR